MESEELLTAILTTKFAFLKNTPSKPVKYTCKTYITDGRELNFVFILDQVICQKIDNIRLLVLMT